MRFLDQCWNVLDMFSGAGGMSFGFRANPAFKVIGAVDAQNGKPSSGRGTLECNKTYLANIGVEPLEADIGSLTEETLRDYLLHKSGTDVVNVLISCAPCTGFSRTVRRNLVEDDPRNSLVAKSAEIVGWFQPDIFVMENVGELIAGKFSHHFENLRKTLEWYNYSVSAAVHSLNTFGLPQTRKRALVIAAKKPIRLRTLEELWQGFRVRYEATTVRRAIGNLPPIAAGERCNTDSLHTSPALSEHSLRRLEWTPTDGGSWPDILKHDGGRALLIPSMLHYADQGRVGPHRDVYGRMAWDQPAVTIKRECSHSGNGRYAHPTQHRLCSVREMAILQGFPNNYKFVASSLANMYRHVGDAVPPLVSYQLGKACEWMLTEEQPSIESIILPGTHLQAEDIQAVQGSLSRQKMKQMTLISHL
jgi:DNA (cytosine-5)-methyltransferase 1